jgi:arginine:pyruvate transaminase
MVLRFARRAAMVEDALHGRFGMRVHRPEAGMFVLLDISATGLSGDAFALALLDSDGVAVMPGESFGNALAGWVRICLTVDDDLISEACGKIAAFAARKQGLAA